MPRSAVLPDFPWDSLGPAKAVASRHPDGLVDLSMGTPVDPVPEMIQAALANAANSPGYPPTTGTPALRSALARWVERTCDAVGGFDVLPTIGSKELVAWLPTLLGVGAGDSVVIPEICYPTYEVGAAFSGAAVVRADALEGMTAAAGLRLIWINSPANPTGRVIGAERLRDIVRWARERDIVVASDECYINLGWGVKPVSVLSVCDGRYDNVLAVHSLSKCSNLAGYRAACVAGDPAIVGELLAVRKHVGMMVPHPVQAAMIAALEDTDHVLVQRRRYAARREALLTAVGRAGLTVEESTAGLYLWATRGEPCWDTVAWFAERGVLVAPGSFYGPGGQSHVRIALTATDERVRAAVERLSR